MMINFFVGALIGYTTGSVALIYFHPTGFSGVAVIFSAAILASAVLTGPVVRLIEKVRRWP